MKNFIPTMAILACAILFNCQGKTGDPGPIGANGAAGANGADGATGPDAAAPFANGSFSGTITGTRADGVTPINETFSYNYDPGYFTLSANVGQEQTFRLLRFQSLLTTENAVQLPLILTNSGQYLDSMSNGSPSFSYSKALTGNQLFKLSVQPVLTKQTVVLPIDPANANYQFDFSYNFAGPNYNYVKIIYDYNGFSGFKTKLGEQVFFDAYHGGAFVKIIDAEGVTSNTSTTYGNLVLNSASNAPLPPYFYFTLNGTDLSKTVTLPADTYSITGYSYDTSTGNMAFNYVINVGGFPKPNSTGNPLTITGSFTGKVSQIVNGPVKSNDSHLVN